MFTNIANTPIDELRQASGGSYAGPVLFPSHLRAHDNQTFGSCSMITRDYEDATGQARTIDSSGFLGRLSGRFAPYIGGSAVPMAISAGQRGLGSDFLTMSGTTKALSIPHVGSRFDRNWARHPVQERALARLDSMMIDPRGETRMDGFRRANLTMNAAVSFFQPLLAAPFGTFAVDADFGTIRPHGWQATMHTFARTIEADLRMPSLHRRTIFVGVRGGYDTHSNQGKLDGNLPRLHSDWAASVMAFRAAMYRLGVWNNVLMTDHSEFSRTFFTGGSEGTEHGYARDVFLLGGSVRGRGRMGSRGVFGSYPTALSVNGTGRKDMPGGALVPGLSLEQYWERIIRWFGADDADVMAAMPRRPFFGPPVDLIA
jgi:hypothetical protein